MPRSFHRTCLALHSKEADLKWKHYVSDLPPTIAELRWVMTHLSICLHTENQWNSNNIDHLEIGYHLITNLTTIFESRRHQRFIQDTLTFCSSGHAVSHYKNDAPNCLASMQIQPCWLMLGVVSARMLMLWQVCSMLNKKNTGIAVKANTASQMKAKMYVTMMNCRKKKVQHIRSEKCNIEAQWDKSDYIHNSVQKSLEQRTLHWC